VILAEDVVMEMEARPGQMMDDAESLVMDAVNRVPEKELVTVMVKKLREAEMWMMMLARAETVRLHESVMKVIEYD
jgi:hypothetical protein